MEKHESKKSLEEIFKDTKIEKVDTVDNLKKSFISYAMAVNVSRAIPDVRDGLKPVHRRILYAMGEMNNFYDKPTKKCARIVGDVMGKYHKPYCSFIEAVHYKWHVVLVAYSHYFSSKKKIFFFT